MNYVHIGHFYPQRCCEKKSFFIQLSHFIVSNDKHSVCEKCYFLHVTFFFKAGSFSSFMECT